ncbi:hypothetical protein ACFQY9_34340 [Microvirga aerilata]|uniref:hypothetical protein n=1 Tax=Microvirga aerilata TaxID=670292 RepID=UPI0036271C67
MSNSTSITIMLEEDPNGTFADEVERELLAALRQNTPPGDGKSSRWSRGTFRGAWSAA